jgi:hypothetical protein
MTRADRHRAVHTSLVVLAAALRAMQTLIGSIEKRIMAQHRRDMPAFRT